MYAKQLRISKHADEFIKEASVFADWREDTPKIIQDCIRHDMKYWKTKRLVNDYASYGKVTEVIRFYFAPLKEIF